MLIYGREKLSLNTKDNNPIFPQQEKYFNRKYEHQMIHWFFVSLYFILFLLSTCTQNCLDQRGMLKPHKYPLFTLQI